MTAVLLPNGKQHYETSAGIPLVGGKVFTYDSGTLNPRTTWADAGQVAPNANPVILDARGEATIFWSGSYRVIVQDSLGNVVIPAIDGVSDQNYQDILLRSDLATSGNSAKGAGMVGFDATISYTAGTVGSFLYGAYRRTAAEIAAGVTPTNFFYDEGVADRYGTNTSPGTTDMRAALLAAAAVYTAGGPAIRLLGRTYYVSNDTTLSAPVEYTGNSRLSIASGKVVSGIYNPILYVGDGSLFALVGDIGAQINAAYAALPAKGGKIVVMPKFGGGKYDFSTPIIFATAGKYPVLEGVAPGGAVSTEGCCLNYTPVTATAAISMDYSTFASGPPSTTHGIRDITLVNNGITTTGGAGSLATGIKVGTTNGGDFDAAYERVTLQGFGLAYSCLNNNAVDQQWNNCCFLNNTACLTISVATQRFIGGQFAGNGKVFLQPNVAQQSELYFTGTNFYDNITFPNFDYTVNTAAAALHLCDCHLENSPVTDCKFIQGAVNVTITGGLMEDDNATGSATWMVKTDNFTLVSIIGTKILASRTLACVVDMSNQVRAFLAPNVQTASNVTAIAAGAFAAEATVIAINVYPNTPYPYNMTGSVVQQTPGKEIGLGNYANDAAAAAGGVPLNGNYRNGSVRMVRVV